MVLGYSLNGASDRNRTGILALARPYTNRCTTPALDTNIIYKNKKYVNTFLNNVIFFNRGEL